ncbi:hypothetical protein GQ457_01G035400 [Hibiscus cannabinus]
MYTTKSPIILYYVLKRGGNYKPYLLSMSNNMEGVVEMVYKLGYATSDIRGCKKSSCWYGVHFPHLRLKNRFGI